MLKENHACLLPLALKAEHDMDEEVGRVLDGSGSGSDDFKEVTGFWVACEDFSKQDSAPLKFAVMICSTSSRANLCLFSELLISQAGFYCSF